VRRRLLLTGLALATLAAVSGGLLATGGEGSRLADRPAAARHGGALRVGMAADQRRGTAAGPTCPAPPLPPPTAPPGQPYGVPFVAAIDNVTVLSGFNEYTAISPLFRSYSPWTSTLYGFTGWVTGWLDVPSLAVSTSASQITFCQVTATPPTGPTKPFLTEGFYTLKSFATNGQVVTTTNDPSKATEPFTATLYSSITLAPVGTPQLRVIGVRPDGSLDLGGVIAAAPTITMVPPLPPQVCQAPATEADLSTATSGPLPASGPPRRLRDATPQFTPEPLTGPLVEATATQTADDFQVPAFSYQNGLDPVCFTFNAALAGFDALKKSNPSYPYLSRYPAYPSNPPVASQPGWSQMDTTIQIYELGMPTGSPYPVVPQCQPLDGPPYQLGVVGTFSGGQLKVGYATVSGLTGGISGTFCGIASVVPGQGPCPAKIVLTSPPEGQQFNPLGITFDVVPGMTPDIRNGSVVPGQLQGQVTCPEPARDYYVQATATAQASASTGLFGLACDIGPVSIPLSGILSGTPPALTGTLTSAPFTVPPGTAGPTCPSSVVSLLDSIGELPFHQGTLSITVTASTYAPSP
jgi:hypothetical protein